MALKRPYPTSFPIPTMARSRPLHPVKLVLLCAITGTCMALLLCGLGQSEPVTDAVQHEVRCLRAHTPDAAFGLARALCRADVPGFSAQR
ncbi:hypothetical protein LMG32289_05506 [Cupriavidus pampae]|uniref:Secreted protein n=2 Tax=Cupriavidus pampae TaxID=659251 RepID=A0ABM8XUP0_9BURK|nr:hypothetical protein LMG32289_05506 [Cupriavidus pampae]